MSTCQIDFRIYVVGSQEGGGRSRPHPRCDGCGELFPTDQSGSLSAFIGDSFIDFCPRRCELACYRTGAVLRDGSTVLLLGRRTPQAHLADAERE